MIAAFDCGTNTIKLLIGELPEVAVRESRMVRLGQGVDRTGWLSDEALARAFAAIDEYAGLVRSHGVATSAIRFCATSATRDASNAQEFSDGVLARIGVRPEVIAGSEEAALAFDGAVRNLRDAPAEPVLVIDIGGGSTELILGSGGAPDAAYSMDIGSVRLHERHLHDDPPTAQQVAAASADVAAALDAAADVVPLGRTATLVGVAGSVTTVTAHTLQLSRYDPERIHGSVLPVGQVLAASRDLLERSRAYRAALPFMHPGRVDVIGAGALVWSDVISRVRAEVAAAGGQLTHVVTSEHDILDGIALSAADHVPA